MHVHAILDESAGAILDAWEEVDREHPIGGLRFCLAHAEGVSDANLRRARGARARAGAAGPDADARVGVGAGLGRATRSSRRRRCGA